MKIFNSSLDLPSISPKGFHIVECPRLIFDPIITYYDYLRSVKGEDSNLYPIGDHAEFLEWVGESFRPIFEKWVNLPVEFSYIYGIKSYKNKETIEFHTDHISTHHFCAMLVVGKDKDWPFHLKDHNEKWNIVNKTSIGDIILFEGGKLLNGRPIPFEGENYSILYIHYRLKDWKYVNK